MSQATSKLRKLLSGLVAGSVAATVLLLPGTPASAGPFDPLPPPTWCMNTYTFLRLDPTQKYLSIENTQAGIVRATGRVAGWWEAFYVCGNDDGWPRLYTAYKSAATGRFLTVDANTGQLRADHYSMTTNALFVDWLEWWNGGVMTVSLQSANGMYVSGAHADNIVRASATSVGWYEAFNEIG